MKQSNNKIDYRNILESSDVNITWSKNIDACVKSLDMVKQITRYSNIDGEIGVGLTNRIDKFIKDAKNPEFHIALVGAIKAGKSTLINAILGEDLASSSVTPETASLTKFKASKESNYVKLDFYSNDEWNSLWKSVEESKSEVFIEKYNNLNAEAEKGNWLGKESIEFKFDNLEDLKNEIKKWTSCNFAQHYFVKEVEVGLVGFDIPEGVVFVDTPGLDDPVRYRSDITRRYIDRANTVLVCVSASALTGQELSTIQRVFANARYSKEKIYVIGTQTDKLEEPKQEWEQQKKEWIMQLKGKDLYSSEDLAKQNIMGVSAYVENFCRNIIKDKIKKTMSLGIRVLSLAEKYQLIDDDSMEEISNNLTHLDLAKELRKNTGYFEFRDKLYNEIVRKHAQFLEQELIIDYKDIKKEILEKTTMIKQRQESLLAISMKNKNNIVNNRNYLTKKLEESKKEEAEIKVALKNIERMSNERASKLFKNIENAWMRA